jgi:hypothetical protein
MRSLRWFPLVLLGVFIAGLRPGVAAADNPTPYHTGWNKGRTSYSATITTSGRGVVIYVTGRQSSSGQYVVPVSASSGSPSYASGSAAASSVSSGTASSVARTWYNQAGEPYYQTGNGTVYHLAGLNIGTASEGPQGWFTVGMDQHPGTVPEALYVNGHLQGIVWVPVNGQGNVQLASAGPGNAAGAASAPVVVDPRVVAMAVLQRIPLPNVVIRMNPSLGLVAMPGWFWGEGYNGEPFGGSATVGTYTVAVQVEPVSYTWDFGDGTTLVSDSLGKPYPAESDIQHTYQYSSLHYASGFPIRLTIQFSASFSVNGGPAEPLSGMTRTSTASYRVQEVQSILTNR